MLLHALTTNELTAVILEAEGTALEILISALIANASSLAEPGSRKGCVQVDKCSCLQKQHCLSLNFQPENENTIAEMLMQVALSTVESIAPVQDTQGFRSRDRCSAGLEADCHRNRQKTSCAAWIPTIFAPACRACLPCFCAQCMILSQQSFFFLSSICSADKSLASILYNLTISASPVFWLLKEGSVPLRRLAQKLRGVKRPDPYS